VSDEGEFAGLDLEGWMIEDWRRDGIHPAWIDVYLEKRLMPNKAGHFRSEDEHRRWQEAVEGLHPEAGPADHPREFVKWRAHEASSVLEFCRSTGFISPAIEALREDRFAAGAYLEDVREELLAAVAGDDALRREVAALAEKVGGRELVEECRDSTSPVALLIIALARLERT
jgi:hypothetical protein